MSGKRKRASKLSAIAMLENKFAKKAELKEKELELWRIELELQKRKMDREERKMDMEEEERKLWVQLELEERRAMLELLKKHL